MQITAESIIKHNEALCDDVVKDVELTAKLIRLTAIVFVGGAIYGFSMGLRHSILQALTSAIKVPGLFFITLLICLTTLHFMGLLFGSKMSLTQTLTILLTGVATSAVLLGSFAPISLFFLLSGSQYEFLLLMHVLIFIIAGGAGLVYIQSGCFFICLSALRWPISWRLLWVEAPPSCYFVRRKIIFTLICGMCFSRFCVSRGK